MSDGLMIDVENLTKSYTGRVAVANVSFAVQQGEIVGLLGPNGAGKSTIMRILSCFMPATSGTVRVAGFDVFKQADEVRRRIGYMPENNPLHRDMRVREYLRFRGSLKRLRGNLLRERVDWVMEHCGVLDVESRIIGHLSKGYQQRVGLADALINDPALVILDEPTIGLDPNQIRSVRQLIKELAHKRTVLLSTHILPEVEMTCHRVLILHEGVIRAADSPENLQQIMSESGQVVAEIAASVSELKSAWEQVPDILSFDLVPAEGDYIRCALSARVGVDLRPHVYSLACERRWRLRELTRSRHSLEDIFVRVTRADVEEEGF
jgi:gliding motility-associated transport system ATP-binding protein